VSHRLLALLVATAAVGAGLLCVFLWEPSARPVVASRTPRPVLQAGADNRVELSVTEHGFEPSPVHVKAGVPVTLVVTRKTEQTCATELVVAGTNLKVPLPLDVPVTVTFLPQRSGALRYGCSMEMMVSGVLLVD
jgi:plastocyanin domain-containing protein